MNSRAYHERFVNEYLQGEHEVYLSGTGVNRAFEQVITGDVAGFNAQGSCSVLYDKYMIGSFGRK